MTPTRAYTIYKTPFIKRVKDLYQRQPMPEVAAQLGVSTVKLYALVKREGMQKRKSNK